MDTIFALASARGKSGVAVIRVSGPLSHDVAARFCGPVALPRQAAVRLFRGSAGDVVDQVLVLVFEEGHSFTGEKVVEFQVHGSMAVVARVLDELSDVPGLRMAQPGEFTRRALENERLDLTRVEALSDLIEAETEGQRVLAMRVFSGALGEKVQSWRTRLVRAAALLEATIDFVDEDVPVDVGPEVSGLCRDVSLDLRAEAAGASTAERVRDGFEVAIIGEANVGKSTLLNRLAGRDAAITSEVAGTTRDVIEVRMDLRGLPVTFLDTAGLRDTSDVVETIGIERTRSRAARADLRVFLKKTAVSPTGMEPRQDDIVLVGKSDISAEGTISGKTGAGVEALIEQITRVLERRMAGVGVAIRARHRHAMERANEELFQAIELLDSGFQETEIVAEHLRRAGMALDSLIGRVDVEHVLDEIFSNFCIGK